MYLSLNPPNNLQFNGAHTELRENSINLDTIVSIQYQYQYYLYLDQSAQL